MWKICLNNNDNGVIHNILYHDISTHYRTKNSSLLNSYYMHFSVLFMIQNDDETFPITNKPKHPKKGEYNIMEGPTSK